MNTSEKIAIIVDDDENMLKYLEMLIEGFGWKVSAHSSPFFCPLYHGEAQCDLLLTDFNMPGMNGIEFVKHLQYQQRAIEKIVVMSGFMKKDEREEAESLGCMTIKKIRIPKEIEEILS